MVEVTGQGISKSDSLAHGAPPCPSLTVQLQVRFQIKALQGPETVADGES